MRVLLDENLPRRLRRLFSPSVEAITVPEHGWSGLKNGDLLRASEGEFDAFVTADRRIPYQQNLARFDIAVVILEARSNSYQDLAPLVYRANEALEEARLGQPVRLASSS